MKGWKVAVTLWPAALLATQAQAQFCSNDNDCACGEVCSYDGAGQSCVAAATDPGWCTLGAVDNGCLYAGQSCCGIYCYPAWTPDAGCLKPPDGGLETSTGGPVCPTGGSSGSSSSSASTTASGSTTGGGSGSSASASSVAGSSSGGEQSSSSVVTSRSSSAQSGTTTGGSSGSSSSGGGCSSAPGAFSFAALLAVGLLARSRRRSGAVRRGNRALAKRAEGA